MKGDGKHLENYCLSEITVAQEKGKQLSTPELCHGTKRV